MESGATDFLAKPVDPSDLVPRIRNALIVKAHHDHLARYSEHLEEQVRLRTAELEASRLHVIHCLARAAEYRDDTTGRHVLRVGRYAVILARELGFAPAEAEMLGMAAQLHDVGKIGLPDSVLLKPGRAAAGGVRGRQAPLRDRRPDRPARRPATSGTPRGLGGRLRTPPPVRYSRRPASPRPGTTR